MRSTAVFASPASLGQPERRREDVARTAAPGRWEEPIDSHGLLALPERLVPQLTNELAKRGITETPAQLGSRKGGERQVFHDDHVVCADDLCRELVKEVLALISDATVLTGES